MLEERFAQAAVTPFCQNEGSDLSHVTHRVQVAGPQVKSLNAYDLRVGYRNIKRFPRMLGSNVDALLLDRNWSRCRARRRRSA